MLNSPNSDYKSTFIWYKSSVKIEYDEDASTEAKQLIHKAGHLEPYTRSVVYLRVFRTSRDTRGEPGSDFTVASKLLTS
jgi:hypothetical protein